MLDAATKRRILHRYQTSDETVEAIGKAFNRSAMTISRVVRGQARRMPVNTPEMIEKAGKLYREGTAIRTVGALLGVGEVRARTLILAAGCELRPAGWPEQLWYGRGRNPLTR